MVLRILSFQLPVISFVFLAACIGVYGGLAAGAQPDHGANFEKGLAEFKAENYEEALELLLAAYGENPKDPLVTRYLALTNREMQNYPEAIRFFRETLELESVGGGGVGGSREVRVYLAESLYDTGDFQGALSALGPVIDSADKFVAAEANYLEGKIFIKENKNEEALRALERAKALDPSLTEQADFQMAVVYYRAGEFKKAERIFKDLAEKDARSDWASFAEEYLETLRRAPPKYRLNVSAGLEYDDNVLAVPIDQSLVNIKKQGDWKKVFMLYGGYDLYGKGPWDLKAAYALNIIQYFKSDYARNDGTTVFSQDTVRHKVSMLPSYSAGRSIIAAGISYSYLEIDYTGYLRTFSVNPSYTFPVTENNYAEVSLKYRKDSQDLGFYVKKFGFFPVREEERGARNYSAAVDLTRVFSSPAEGRGLAEIRLEGEYNDADGSNWVYWGYKASAGVSYPFMHDRVKANLFAELYGRIFPNVNSIYGGKRRDYTAAVQPSLTYSLAGPVYLTLGYSYIEDISNIGVYRYAQNLFSGDIGFRF